MVRNKTTLWLNEVGNVNLQTLTRLCNRLGEQGTARGVTKVGRRFALAEAVLVNP